MSTPELPEPHSGLARGVSPSLTCSSKPCEGMARGLLLPERLGLFALFTVACCMGSSLGLGRPPVLVPLAIAAVAVAMWHGAYDHVLAEQCLRPDPGPVRRFGFGSGFGSGFRFGFRFGLPGSSRFGWLPLFLAGYAGLAGATLLAWWLFPVFSLAAFLLYSAWHFGTEPEQFSPLPLPSFVALALGAAPLVAACRWHAAAVTPIFASMLGARPGSAHTAAQLTGLMSALCFPLLFVALLGIAGGVLGRPLAVRVELLLVLLLQVALFVFCSPLAAFAVFFCCWHTPEHLLATSLPGPGDGPGAASVWQGMGRNLRAGAVPWLLSLGVLGLALRLGRHEAAAYQGELFILLSALTVPHMALNELRRSRRRPGAVSRVAWGSRPGKRGAR